MGTVIRELDPTTMEPAYDLADLTHDGERVVVAPGGTGGLGNPHFVTSTRRAPAFAQKGEPAIEHWIELEMKLMADAALVGFPSVGKSSLIARMSAARPKIADYPFTTLVPNLGMVRAGEYSYVVADVPGLIEGAAEGKGLGHQFLRHVERTALILHVVDITGSYEGRDPLEDYRIINDELRRYASDLADRPQIVVANKCDASGVADRVQALKMAALEDGHDFFAVSALTGAGLQTLMLACGERVSELRRAIAEEQAAAPAFDEEKWERARKARDKRFRVLEEEPGAWRVTGTNLERMVVQTDWENEEAIIYLQHRMARMGVDDASSRPAARMAMRSAFSATPSISRVSTTMRITRTTSSSSSSRSTMRSLPPRNPGPRLVGRTPMSSPDRLLPPLGDDPERTYRLGIMVERSTRFTTVTWSPPSRRVRHSILIWCCSCRPVRLRSSRAST